MNSVNLMGRMVADAEIRETSGGKKMISFRVAIDAGKDRTYFIPCMAWNGTAENIAKYFKKGDRIGLSGIITSRDYTDKNGNNRTAIEVLVNSFDFCSGKKKVEDSGEDVPSGEGMPFEI